MKFSTIQNYIEAVESLGDRLRDKSDLVTERDGAKQLLYKVSRGVVCFDLKGGKGLYMFLNEDAFRKFVLKNPKVNVLFGQLYVSTGDDDGFWADIALGHSCNSQKESAKASETRFFTEGIRAAQRDGKWGFVDREERFIIDPIWDEVEDFAEGRALVRKGEFYGLIDNRGIVVIDPIYDELSWDGSGYAYGERMGMWGACDRCGKVVINFEWDWVGEFSFGYAIVERNEKSGFVNKKGELIITPKYDQATSFNEHGVASVQVEEDSFFIDFLDRRV